MLHRYVFHFSTCLPYDAIFAQCETLSYYLLIRTQRTKSGDSTYETPDSLRPMPYPDRDPNALPYSLYSGLMGLLCTSGANLSPGSHHYWFPEVTVLRISNSNQELLEWMGKLFGQYITWTSAGLMQTANSFRLISMSSEYLYILRQHWGHSDLTHFLPDHFEYYFSEFTMAFWVMRNGKWRSGVFQISVSRLNAEEVGRLISVLQTKLGVFSDTDKTGKVLYIRNTDVLFPLIRPHMHVSQLHRLVYKTKTKKSK